MKMGCPISKQYLPKNKMLFAGNKDAHEWEPTKEGSKQAKKIYSIEPKGVVDRKVEQQYTVKKLIGKGTFSDVYRVEHKHTKLPYALKAMEIRSLKGRDLFQSEFNILKDLNKVRHEGIIGLVDVITTKLYGYIVMELATGGDLYERIKAHGAIEEPEARRITGMLLSALEFLHSHGVTHRDLKPDNVLFYSPGEKSKVMITDFGFAIATDCPYETYCGTLQYLSPEVIEEKPYTNKVDVWSLGVLVYVMLCGNLPFSSENIMQLHEKITTVPHKYKKEIWNHISDQAKSFIDGVLKKDPNYRSSAKKASQHPWIGRRVRRHRHHVVDEKTRQTTKAFHTVCVQETAMQQSRITQKQPPYLERCRTPLPSSPNMEILQNLRTTCPDTTYGLSSSDGVIRHNFGNSRNQRARSLDRITRLPARQLVLPDSKRWILKDELFDASESASTTENSPSNEDDGNNDIILPAVNYTATKKPNYEKLFGVKSQQSIVDKNNHVVDKNYLVGRSAIHRAVGFQRLPEIGQRTNEFRSR